MAVDLTKFPTQSGTGTGTSPRISHSYPTLVNTDHTQTEGGRIDDDSICFATSNNKLLLSPMCQKTYIEFGFNLDIAGSDAHTIINKRVTSNYGKAGCMLFKKNATRNSRVNYEGGVDDPMNNIVMENDYSYSIAGNVSNTNNNVSFCTGFSWWQTYGIIYVIMAIYDGANGYFDCTRTGNTQPTLMTVTLAEYNNTYVSNPNYVPVGAFLNIVNGTNQLFCVSPWCGYKSPVITVGAMLNPDDNLTKHRVISISDNTPLNVYTFGDGGGVSAQSGYDQWGINGCYSTAPLVDVCMCSAVMRYRNNLYERWSYLFGWYSLGAIRGGANVYTLEQTQFKRYDQNEIRDGFITKVIINKLINSAATYGILITDRVISTPASNAINTKAKLRTWALSGDGQYVYVPIPESDGTYAGKVKSLLNFIDTSNKDESPYYPKSNGDMASMLNNPDLSFDNSKGGGGSNVTPSTDETPLNNVQLNTVGVFNRCFAVSQNDLYALANYIYNADDTIAEAVIKGVKFMGDTPSNALISLALTPFNLPAFVGGGVLEYIKLGRQTTTIQGLALSSTMTSTVDFGDIYIPYPHEDYGVEGYSFLDVEPYTTITLYIPYVGVLELSPKEVIGKRLNVKLVIDWSTGSCCGSVFVNGIMTTYRTGTITTQVSMTAVDYSVNIGAIISGLISTGAGIATATIGGSTGNPMAIAGGTFSAVNGITSTFDGLTPQTQYKNTGTTTAGTARYLPPYPYIIISTVKPVPPENYGSTVGYACNTYGTLSAFSGFTVCEGFKSNCARTETENDLINQLLNSGVIV